MADPSHRPSQDGATSHPHLREVADDSLDANTGVSTELTRARKARGSDLQDVARDLRIRPSHLKALEERRFDDLPGRPYVLGFLRTYATYLGLDADDIITRFKAETSDFGDPQKLEFPLPADEGRTPGWLLLVLALVLAAAVYASWYYLNTSDRLVVDKVPEVPANLLADTTPAVAPRTTGVAAAEAEAPPAALEPASLAPTTPAPAAPAIETSPLPEAPATTVATRAGEPRVFGQADSTSRVKLRATAASWVQVTGPDNELLLEKTLNPGDVYHVPDRPDLMLTTGNAGALEVTVDGRVAPSLGPKGAVRRNVALDTESLLAGATPAR